MEQYSVLMSLYKKEKPEYLRHAIDSMIHQTVKPDEIVIVEDGPLTDELYAVLDEYASSITRVRNEKNLGLGLALNVGLKACRNELVARMDTDDVSIAHRCEKQLAFFQRNPELSVVGGNIQEFVGDPSNCVGKRIVPSKDAAIKEYMKKRCPMNHMSVMFRKKDVAEVGGYMDWYCDEDYYLWVRMAMGGKSFGNLNEILVNVRVGDEMYSRRGGVRYFKSEAKLQKLMLEKGVISWGRYFINVLQRLVLQVLMPNRLRGFLFQKLAREK